MTSAGVPCCTLFGKNESWRVRPVVVNICAIRFLYIKVLKRRDMKEDLPYPKERMRLPAILSPGEVAQLIGGARNLYHRTMLILLYGTGLRRSEMCRLKVSDIDSKRMMLRVEQGKGGIDREVPLTKKLLTVLREYYRWMKPQTYLFPGTVDNWRADKPITDKVVWEAVREAALRAGIKKRVTPHTLRHASAYYTTFQSSFILKIIGIVHVQLAAVYGRDGRLVFVPGRLATRDSFDR